MNRSNRHPTYRFLCHVFERRQHGYLWGQRSSIKPVVCDKRFGDGKALIGLSTINGRPNFYVLQLDSEKCQDFQTDEFRDHLERAEEYLLEWLGPRENDGEEDSDDPNPWPAYDESGCSWWRISLDDIVERLACITENKRKDKSQPRSRR
jgi:hypothetical protein